MYATVTIWDGTPGSGTIVGRSITHVPNLDASTGMDYAYVSVNAIYTPPSTGSKTFNFTAYSDSRISLSSEDNGNGTIMTWHHYKLV